MYADLKNLGSIMRREQKDENTSIKLQDLDMFDFAYLRRNFYGRGEICIAKNRIRAKTENSR